MKKRLRTGESRSLSNQKKKISPQTKKLLLLTLLCTALLFGFYMFAQYQIGGLFSFVVFCIYAFLCAAFVLAYIIYNRGFSRKNLTLDRLPDYMTFAEKEEYIEDGKRRIGITRIHLEEDAGKLIPGEDGTKIDCNRCGVPLIEIVSEPDIRSAAEARAYLSALRERLVFADVSDCRMNEGSM